MPAKSRAEPVMLVAELALVGKLLTLILGLRFGSLRKLLSFNVRDLTILDKLQVFLRKIGLSNWYVQKWS